MGEDMKILQNKTKEYLDMVEIMANYAIENNITVEESKKALAAVLLTKYLMRPRMGGYAGKIDLQEVARYRNEKLKEKLNERKS